MILAVHGDTSYLSKPKTRIWAGRHLFLSNEARITQNNGAIINIAHIIKHVMTSATEAGGTLHHGTRRRIHQNNLGEDGAQTTTNSITKR